MSKSPEIWALLGEKLGDNAQVHSIINALGHPVEIKTLRMQDKWGFGKPRFRASLDHLDQDHSDILEPPWPRLILTIGRRLSQAALWIKEQSNHTCKIALVGRPKRWTDKFDLVIGLPQYILPDAPNVVPLSMPLMRPDLEKIQKASAMWQSEMDAMPRPLTAVFVGGRTLPYRFDRTTAQDLGKGLQRYLENDGGSLFISTSRRTGGGVSEELKKHLTPPSRLFDFRNDPPDANPYHALLGSADRFVVTTDSISMIVECARMQKQLAIYPLQKMAISLNRMVSPLGAVVRSQTSLGKILRHFGATGFTRDLDGFRRSLVASGLAVDFGQPFQTPSALPEDDLERAVHAVRSLL